MFVLNIFGKKYLETSPKNPIHLPEFILPYNRQRSRKKPDPLAIFAELVDSKGRKSIAQKGNTLMSGIKSYSSQISSGERAALTKYRDKGLDEYFPALALKKKMQQQGLINVFGYDKSKNVEKFEFKPFKSIDVDRRDYVLENIIKEAIKNNDELARIKREKNNPYSLSEDSNAVTVNLSPEAKEAVSGDVNEASTSSTNDTPDATPSSITNVDTIV